jgi:hypothetical protein
MMGEAWRGEREPGKSDRLDARAVARAVVREGAERFPTAFLDQRALEIRPIAPPVPSASQPTRTSPVKPGWRRSLSPQDARIAIACTPAVSANSTVLFT